MIHCHLGCRQRLPRIYASICVEHQTIKHFSCQPSFTHQCASTHHACRHNHSLPETYQKCTMRVEANEYNIKQSSTFHVSHLSHTNAPPHTMHADTITHILKNIKSVPCVFKQMSTTSNNQTLFMSAIVHREYLTWRHDVYIGTYSCVAL